MSDLFVEIGPVLFLDDFSALLTDGLVKLDAMPVARRLSAFAADVFVKGRAVTVANGVAALLARFTHRHLALRALVVLFSHRSLLRYRRYDAAAFRFGR